MQKTQLYNTLIQHVHHAQIRHKVHTTRLYNTLIHHAKVRKMFTSSETRLLSVFLKRKRKNFKKTISFKTENTTRIQHEMYTAQKIQHKVCVLGADLEALRPSPR